MVRRGAERRLPPASQEAAMRAAFQGQQHESVSGCGRRSGRAVRRPFETLERCCVGCEPCLRSCSPRLTSRTSPNRRKVLFWRRPFREPNEERSRTRLRAALPETLARMQNVLGVAAQLLPGICRPALLRERQVFDGVLQWLCATSGPEACGATSPSRNSCGSCRANQ